MVVRLHGPGRQACLLRPLQVLPSEWEATAAAAA